MKKLLLVCLLLLVCQGQNKFRQDTNIVTDLFLKETSSKWLDEINDQVPFFAFFYLPDCRHCKKAVPEIESLADNYKNSNSSIKIVGVDCEIKNDFCGFFQVKHYPTIVYVKDIDQIYEYTSSVRKVLALKNFITSPPQDKIQTYEIYEKKYANKSQQRPQFKTSFVPEANIKIITSESYQYFEQNQFILFYKVSCQHCRKFMPVFEQVSKELSSEQLQFSAVNCDTHQYICDTFKIKGVPNLLYFKDGYVLGYGQQRSYEHMKQYLQGGYENAMSSRIPIKKYIQDAHPVADDVRAINTNNILRQNDIIKFFDEQNSRALKIIGMMAFVLILMFLCMLKDCASRSTRKPQKSQKNE